ncbi:MAG: rhodanese-like domain-containing protein [Bacteroidetes bacterium]|nr:rhodanese-like domain-containing protein [Bacteroidota bacterium]
MNKIVIDVRRPDEFMGGHVAGSINIPLNEVEARIEEIKAIKEPIVLCCAGGTRSGRAAEFLKNQGINCVNGGSWLDVNAMINK